ncbi:uncharacterized protein LOC135085923 [Ostrinia nubilalis]|uniref:uncharacterized protein LOC135085923 n=1 Tax=Ostrinia nubilalis TaxID=29057 RepID=UPI0030823DF4
MCYRPSSVKLISVLASGLFREDSVEVEQETPCPTAVWSAAGGRGGWLTGGEGAASLTAVAVCVAAFPPRQCNKRVIRYDATRTKVVIVSSVLDEKYLDEGNCLNRSTLLNIAAYVSIPVAIRAVHRALIRGSLASLLAIMRDYLALARRAAACLKEYAALHAQLGSISSAIENTRALLCRQQRSLALLLSRASAALLGNAPGSISSAIENTRALLCRQQRSLALLLSRASAALLGNALGSISSAIENTRALLCRQQRSLALLLSRASAALLGNAPGSISSAIENTRALLCRQQRSLALLLSRASAALLGNAPWLRADVAWAAVADDAGNDLMKIHHAFLVVQSTLLKHIAMAHFIPPVHAQKIYKNFNERIYWIHTVLLSHLYEEFKQNYEALERMYRLLRNFGNNDRNVVKKPGAAMLDSWAYSDIHNGVARTNLELKFVGNKCEALDVFLDSCALNKQELDLTVLNKDIDEIIDDITKCLNTMQNSQIRLKKLRNKVDGSEKEVRIEEKSPTDDENVIKIDDKLPEVKDEVFYFVKTEDDDVATPADDVTTGPGKKEKETTKIVLKELKRKLGKREDVMRERERQALAKTMPELKDLVPEFPRQINYDDYIVKKGYITKIKKDPPKKKLFRSYRISKGDKKKKYAFKTKKYQREDEISKPFYEANSKLNLKSKLISLTKEECGYCVTKWCKYVPALEIHKDKELDPVCMSETSDIEAGPAIDNNQVNTNHRFQVSTYKFSKRDLELSPSSSESDYELYKEKQLALLKDIRRHRATRKKNHPTRRSIDKSTDKEDESLKPIEYSFGTGMAMASVLQINSKAKIPNLSQEEVFIGNGEVSTDSGNDEDA